MTAPPRKKACRQVPPFLGVDLSLGSDTSARWRGWSRLGSKPQFSRRPKLKTDSVASVYGAPITTHDKFKEYGAKSSPLDLPAMPEDLLPAQFNFEGFEEMLTDGRMSAEQLSCMVSLAEEQKQDAWKSEATRQYGIHLDAKVTISTKPRHVSLMPKDIAELRHAVLSNLRLLAQIRQQGCPVYSDPDEPALRRVSGKPSRISGASGVHVQHVVGGGEKDEDEEGWEAHGSALEAERDGTRR